MTAAERRARVDHEAFVIHLRGEDPELEQAWERHLFVYVASDAPGALAAAQAQLIGVLLDERAAPELPV